MDQENVIQREDQDLGAQLEVLEELHLRNLLEVAVLMEALQQALIYQQLN